MSAPRSAQLLLSKALTRALSVQALKPSAGTRAGAAAGKNAAAAGKSNAVKAPSSSASSSSSPSASAHQHHQAAQGKQGGPDAAARQGFSKMFF